MVYTALLMFCSNPNMRCFGGCGTWISVPCAKVVDCISRNAPVSHLLFAAVSYELALHVCWNVLYSMRLHLESIDRSAIRLISH